MVTNRPPFHAVLFDMDGLMFDTERLARQGWESALTEHGYSLADDFYLTIVGRAIPDVRALLFSEYGPDLPFEAIYTRRQQIYEELLERDGVPLKPGLVPLLEFLRSHRVPLAVASSTPRAFGERKIAASGLGHFFRAFAFGDEVSNGKPAPDVFLLAARRLGVPIASCVVIEDSEAGIRSAHAAGALALMVPDAKQPGPEVAALAYRVLPSLETAPPVIAQLLEISAPTNDDLP